VEVNFQSRFTERRRCRSTRMMARPKNFAATIEERQRLVAEAFSAPELSVVIPVFNEDREHPAALRRSSPIFAG
jgi:hypothetical protein